MSNTINLYKYCRIPSYEYWNSLLTQIKFSSFSNLNDLFEGFLRAKDQDFEDLKKKFNQWRVSSLSCVKPYSEDDSEPGEIDTGRIYMWSHYADAMKGVCLEYEFNELVNPEVKHEKINYEKVKEDSWSNKLNIWHFEEEYRFCFEDKSRKIEEYKNLSELGLKLKTVYFGIRTLNDKNLLSKESAFQELKKHSFAHYLSCVHETKIELCARSKSQYKVVKLDLP